MKALRFLRQTLLILALFLLPVVASCSTNASQATKRISPCVVQIVVADNITNGEALNVTLIGSGFFVNRAGWLITAKSVIDLATEEVRRKADGASIEVVVPGDPTTGMGFSSDSNPLAVLANELEFEATPRLHNLALVKVKTDLGPNPDNGAVHPVINHGTHVSGTLNFDPVPLVSRQLKTGDAVAASGYLSTGINLTTSSGRITSTQVTPVTGVLPATAGNGTAPMYIAGLPTDISSSPVLSGAPVDLASSGAIIGMFVDLPGQTQAVIVPASDIVDFLDNYGIEWRR